MLLLRKSLMDSGAPAWVPRASGRPADLALNFRTNASYILGRQANLDDVLTCSRASAGYASDTAGVYRSFDNNRLRRTNAGILIEESRTNSIRNNSMQGAVAGTPGTLPSISGTPSWSHENGGGLTKTIVGTGVQNGVEYIDIRWNGTTATQTNARLFFELTQIITGSVGQTWTNSAFLSIAGGSTANITTIALGFRESAATSALSNNTGSDIKSSITSTPSRQAHSAAIAQATADNIAPYIQMTYSLGVAIDITLRIGWPQLELGSFATSPIRTTNAALTRNADVVTMTLPARLQSKTAYTLFTQWIEPANSKTHCASSIFGNPERIALTINSSNVLDAQIVAGGADSLNDVATPILSAGRYKAAIASASNNGALAYQGTVSSDATITTPANVLTVGIGSRNSALDPLNSTIEQIAVWGYRISNPDLVRLTA